MVGSAPPHRGGTRCGSRTCAAGRPLHAGATVKCEKCIRTGPDLIAAGKKALCANAQRDVAKCLGAAV
jgi:hypothetical protein